MRWIVALPIVAACGFGAPSISGDAPPGGDAPSDGDAPPGGDAGTDASSAPWWDPAWPVRMRIVIDSAAPLVSGFQLGLRRDLDAAPCNGPRDRVRVVRDHTTELPRVIDEVGGGDEWIWFRLTAARPAGTGPSEYWLYCGNAGAGPAPSDPAAVFDLHDEFNGTTLSSSWAAQGAVTVGGGAVTLPNGTTIRSASQFGAGTATDFILQVSQSALGNPWFWGGFEVGFNVSPPWVIWHSEDPNVIKQEIARPGPGNEVSMNPRTLDLDPHLYGVEHHGMSARFRFHNAEAGTIPYGGSIGSLNVRIHNYMSSGPIQLLMARVRKAVNPIPTVTLGPVENRP